MLLPLFMSLGFWQLRRAAEKEALIALRDQQSAAAPLRLVEPYAGLDALRYRNVTAVGAFDTSRQFLLDNQIHAGRVGYSVLTPLRLANSTSAVLVNRGWVAAPPTRAELPSIPVRDGELTLVGQIDALPSVGLRLAGAERPTPGWPAVVQLVDPAVAAEVLGYPVLPYQVLLDAASPDGYLRDWKPANVDPTKNQGYALQWFAFAGVLVLLFLRNTIAKKNNDRHGMTDSRG